MCSSIRDLARQIAGVPATTAAPSAPAEAPVKPAKTGETWASRLRGGLFNRTQVRSLFGEY